MLSIIIFRFPVGLALLLITLNSSVLIKGVTPEVRRRRFGDVELTASSKFTSDSSECEGGDSCSSASSPSACRIFFSDLILTSRCGKYHAT
jgi:hypothetical protein